MNWFTDLFAGTGVAHSIFIYAIVIAIGVILGKVKIKGISLGATFVLFVGILAGHLGLSIDMNTLKFIQEFGLILFIFSIGLQVGPSFFSSFNHVHIGSGNNASFNRVTVRGGAEALFACGRDAEAIC